VRTPPRKSKTLVPDKRARPIPNPVIRAGYQVLDAQSNQKTSTTHHHGTTPQNSAKQAVTYVGMATQLSPTRTCTPRQSIYLNILHNCLPQKLQCRVHRPPVTSMGTHLAPYMKPSSQAMQARALAPHQVQVMHGKTGGARWAPWVGPSLHHPHGARAGARPGDGRWPHTAAASLPACASRQQLWRALAVPALPG
jgi:hypothetical protein